MVRIRRTSHCDIIVRVIASTLDKDYMSLLLQTYHRHLHTGKVLMPQDMHAHPAVAATQSFGDSSLNRRLLSPSDTHRRLLALADQTITSIVPK